MGIASATHAFTLINHLREEHLLELPQIILNEAHIEEGFFELWVPANIPKLYIKEVDTFLRYCLREGAAHEQFDCPILTIELVIRRVQFKPAICLIMN